jgi:hypothetical protein
MEIRNLKFALVLVLFTFGINVNAHETTESIIIQTALGETGRGCVFNVGQAAQPVVQIPTFKDAVIKSHHGFLLVLNRLGAGSLKVIDPKNPRDPLNEISFSRLANQAEIDNRINYFSNPQDIVIVDDSHAVVTFYDSPYAVLINPFDRRKREVATRIDLRLYADGDGIPEMTRMLHLPGRELIVIQLQLLDRNQHWLPIGATESKLIFVSTKDWKVRDDLTVGLGVSNTLGDIRRHPGGNYFLAFTGVTARPASDAKLPKNAHLDGGYVLLDPETFQPIGDPILLETADRLNGELEGLEFTPWGAFAALTESSYPTINSGELLSKVVEFDPRSGKTLRHLTKFESGARQSVTGLQVSNRRLYIGGSQNNEGFVRSFDLSRDDRAEIPTQLISQIAPVSDFVVLAR